MVRDEDPLDVCPRLEEVDEVACSCLVAEGRADPIDHDDR